MIALNERQDAAYRMAKDCGFCVSIEDRNDQQVMLLSRGVLGTPFSFYILMDEVTDAEVIRLNNSLKTHIIDHLALDYVNHTLVGAELFKALCAELGGDEDAALSKIAAAALQVRKHNEDRHSEEEH